MFIRSPCTAAFAVGVEGCGLRRPCRQRLRCNTVHTTALSSPTPAALKSGRNHHPANMGVVPAGTRLAPEPHMAAGRSLLATFDSPQAPGCRTQYLEIAGNRAICQDGWSTRTIHRAPREARPRRPLMDGFRELCDLREDFSLANDVAAANPKHLAELKAPLLQEAGKHGVPPLDDRVLERMDAQAVGRHDMMGGRFGGWSMYMKDGLPACDYKSGGSGKGGKVTCSSTARRSAGAASGTRRPASSRPTRRPTSASTSGPRWSRRPVPRQSRASPGASRS
jgi:hypothetical protein